MRIVFFGTPEIAAPSLAALAAAYDVVAAVCQPDRPQGRGRKLKAPPAKACCEAHGIPVVQPTKLNDGAFEAWLREQRPDLCAVAAYGRLLKQPLLDVPPLGWLNMHPSLLPRYRGPSPIQSAILNGDEVTGVTIMRVSLEMDAGDILLQEEMPIRSDDTAATLSERLAELGAHLLVQGVGLVARGEAVFTPQDESRAVYCRLFEKRDGLIDWTQPARRVHNLVRAAQPWPAAHTPFQGEPLRILRTEPLDAADAGAPGEVISVDAEGFVVRAGEGAVRVLRVQPAGKRDMSAAEFVRGRRLTPGMRFGDDPAAGAP